MAFAQGALLLMRLHQLQFFDHQVGIPYGEVDGEKVSIPIGI